MLLCDGTRLLRSPRYGFEGRGNASDGDGALEIVGQDGQAGFGGDVFKAPRSEVSGGHQAFNGAEDLLDGTAADCHRVWHRFEPTLHGIEHRFVLPSPDALLFAGRAGERFDKSMICVQRDAPVQDHLRFRLSSDIAEVKQSSFALPRMVREASSRAHEIRNSFSSTLIEMPDSRRFVVNGMTSFMAEQGYKAWDARVISGDYFSKNPVPSFVDPPRDVVYFIADGDPGWASEPRQIRKPDSPRKGWLKRLLG